MNRWGWCMVLGILLAGCAPPVMYSYLVYENPTAYVRLEPSPWVDEDDPATWNAHPATLSRQQLEEALKGLRVREHRAGLILWIRGIAEEQPAFRDDEIDLLTARLLEGLDLAVPQEVVTFYVSHPVNSTRREVTSGGLFVTNSHLHIILSNHRTIYGIPSAGLIYDRRYPLFSLAPLSVDILFASTDVVISKKKEGLLDAILGDERGGEIILDLNKLAMVRM
ncbi:MAG: hypothetical protein AB7T38_13235 [Nitrospirales bacterium]